MKKLLILFFFVLITPIVVSQTFPFNGNFYYVAGSAGTQSLISVGAYPGQFNTSVACTINNADYYNGLAANPVDGYIYYINTTSQLKRLDASGNSIVVCPNIAGVTGAFDFKGRFIYLSGMKINFYNLNSCSVVKQINNPCPASLDLVFNPKNCSIYVVSGNLGNSTVYEVDTNGVVINTINCNNFIMNKSLFFGKDGRLYSVDVNKVASVDLSNGNIANYLNALSVNALNTPNADGCSFIRKTVTVNANASAFSGCTPFNVNFTGIGVADSILNYSWNFGDGSTSTLQNPAHTYTAAGTYTVVLTLNNFSHFDGPCGFIEPNTSTLVINVSPGPGVTISNINNPLCFGSLTGSATANVTGGTSPYTYFWNNGQITNTLLGAGAGTYTLSVTDSKGCVTNTFVTISQPSAINANITTPGQICVNQQVTINSSANGGTGTLSYLWQPGSQSGNSINLLPTSGGTVYYSLTVTDQNNCSATVSNSLIAYDYPVLTIATPPAVCIGDTTHLFASGAYSYFWSNGVNASATTVAPVSNTTYTLTGYNEIGCSTFKTVDVYVNQLPNINITNVPAASCLPLCLDLKSASSSIINTYLWKVNNETASSNTYLNDYCFDKARINTIQLKVTDNNGCSNSTAVSVETYPKPHATFEISGVYTTDEPEVTFMDNSFDNIKSHFWYFGDGTTSTINNPIHLFKDEPVTYKTFLVVKNIYGCADTAVKEIKIEQIPVIYVPNAFTPNGDGLNDLFNAKGVAIKDFKMRVFDRWGEKIFESSDIANGWDGTIKGKEIKNDTYTWMIDYATIKGKADTMTGHVELIK